MPNRLTRGKAEIGAIVLPDGQVTATAAALNLLDGAVAGTVKAGKAVVADANKSVDVLSVTTPLIASVTVTSSAAELNLLHGVTAGTVKPSAALVVDANKSVDVLSITTPLIAGVTVTAGAAAINDLVAGLASGYKIARGQHNTTTAVDDVNTGLATVVAAIADLEAAPALDPYTAKAHIGDQAGSPAAGHINIATYALTSSINATPIAATTFSKNVNWIAVGT